MRVSSLSLEHCHLLTVSRVGIWMCHKQDHHSAGHTE